LEEDGTVVDEDDILLELSNKTFIILTSDEQWQPSACVQADSSAAPSTLSTPVLDTSLSSLTTTANLVSPASETTNNPTVAAGQYVTTTMSISL